MARDDLLAIIDTILDDNPDAAQALKDKIEKQGFELACSSNSSIARDALPSCGRWWSAETILCFTPRGVCVTFRAHLARVEVEASVLA